MSRVLTIAVMAAGLVLTGGVGAGATPLPTDATAPEPTASPEGTTWSLQPATDEGPDSRVSLRHVIEGGEAVSDMVAVTNFGDRPATFAVYASDGTVASDGNFDLIPSDQESVGGGAWITIADVEGSTARDDGGIVLDVPAESTVIVPLEIRVPENATPGDHPAGVVAELVSGDGGGVQFASRVGVRLHLRVAGDVVAELAPEDVTASYSPSWNPFARGTVTVEFAVANAGNVRVGSDATATVAGPWGLASDRAQVTHREVLPGEATIASIEIPVTPLFLTWGDVVATPVVVGDDVIDASLVPGTASFRLWTIPWSQLALLTVLVGAFFLVRGLRRRSAARVQAKIDAAVAAAALERDEPTVSAGQDGVSRPTRQ